MHRVPGRQRKMFASCHVLQSIIRNEINTHRAAGIPDEPQDFIDFYLEQLEKVSGCLFYILKTNNPGLFSVMKDTSWPRVTLEVSCSGSFFVAQQPKDEPRPNYDEGNMIQTIFDLFLGGTETSSTTLYWGLLYMVYYPDIQGKKNGKISSS